MVGDTSEVTMSLPSAAGMQDATNHTSSYSVPQTQPAQINQNLSHFPLPPLIPPNSP